MTHSQSDFRPTSTWQQLQRRAAIVAGIRNFFSERQFVEVETPLLSHDTVVDRYLNPIVVLAQHLGLATENQPELYLQTSPEFGMKRLLAAGAEKIFQIGKAFRCGERGQWHNPEFTMLEWYETKVDYAQGRQRLIELAEHLFPEHRCRAISYRELLLTAAGIDPFTCTIEALRLAAEQSLPDSTSPTETIDRDGYLNLLMGSVVESYLQTQTSIVVYDWPASQAALARTRETEFGPVGERFEWYYRGIELANGYHELLDAEVLRQRNETVNALRIAQGDCDLPVYSRLLEAMDSGLPASCGCAMGVDRLVACLLDVPTIDEVIAFPWERA